MAVDASAAENNPGSMRERELEVEIARLNAEIAVLKGGAEPAEVAARFLTMAASTVDQAMADARREADEIAVEVSAAAEARRDEATRMAEQVEAHTEALRVEAHNQQAAAEAARHEAQRVTDAATDHINKERARVAEEVERLADVRTALESERGALETYHEELKRRVQELAESMVSFMTTEPPLAAVTAIDELTKPAIAPAAAAVEAAYSPAPEAAPAPTATPSAPTATSAAEVSAPPADAAAPTPVADTSAADTPVADTPATGTSAAEAVAPPSPAPIDSAVPESPAAPAADPIASMPAEPTPVADPAPSAAAPVADPASPFGAPAPADPMFAAELAGALGEDASPAAPAPEPQSFIPTDPAASVADEAPAAIDADEMVASIFERVEPKPAVADENEALFGRAAPAAGREVFDTPAAAPTPSFADMMSGGQTDPAKGEFGGVPVVDSAEETPARRKMGGLFSRSRNAEEPVEPVLPEAPAIEGGLFGSQASRLIEQTSPEQLASALADESEEDERFRSFLDGDGENDPSRDWLLRPDQDD